MSVMVLSDAHLSLLATAHLRLVDGYHAVDPDRGQALVQKLAAANRDAYSRRYPSAESGLDWTPRYVEIAWPDRRLGCRLTAADLAALWQASACYLYQLDSPGRERPSIQDSAAGVVEAVRAAAQRLLLVELLPLPGSWWDYRDTSRPWAPSLGSGGW